MQKGKEVQCLALREKRQKEQWRLGVSSEKGGKAEGSQAKTVFSGGGKDETLAAGSSHNRRTEN